ncbi:MAG: lipoyl(octanoyl) transferase LipB [Chloroflexi bacterium]|nr:lipoyl(octanoyl) transferase LipB [Chloroflexota bacterium]
MYLVNLETVPYPEALELQHRIVNARKKGKGEDVLLLLEHPPVLTLGRRATEENIVASPELLTQMGIQVHRVERGGEVTYHGPGQLVGYPILDLRRLQKDIRKYMHSLEEVLIRTLADFGIAGERIEGAIGVWVTERDWAPALRRDLTDAGLHAASGTEAVRQNKIAALGARIEQWIAYHGFALNVQPNLHHFDLIIPCGIRDRGITSMQAELGNSVSMKNVRERVAEHFAEIFEVSLLPVDLPSLLAQLET